MSHKTKKVTMPIDEFDKLLSRAMDYEDDISDNAQSFLHDMSSMLEDALEEEVGNIQLTDKQHTWLQSIADGDCCIEEKW